jgi:hypothetical protein
MSPNGWYAFWRTGLLRNFSLISALSAFSSAVSSFRFAKACWRMRASCSPDPSRT